MNLRRLRRRCEARIAELELPEPFTVPALADQISRQRGQPLYLEEADMPADGPSGMWVPLADADYVYYDQATISVQREQVIVHELAHILCGHASDGPGGPFESLDPAAAWRALGRTAYTDEQEQEAEMQASVILQRARRHPPDRLEDSFG